MRLTAKHAEDAVNRWNDEIPMAPDVDEVPTSFHACVPNSVEGALKIHELVGVIVMGFISQEFSPKQMMMAQESGMDSVISVAIEAAIIATLYAVDEAMKE